VDDQETLRLARAFGARFTIASKVRDGSLRQAATELGIKMLVYEAGQADRFDEEAIDRGVTGIMRTLHAMHMVDVTLPRGDQTRVLRRTRWIRARRGGLVDIDPDLGDRVAAGDVVARISDAFGGRPTHVKATMAGWAIARTLSPLVNPGDALIHVGVEKGPDRDEPAERGR
jgi:predicted deacylase